MLLLLLPVALAAGPAPVDLDGDGKTETISVAEDGVHVGDQVIPCDSYELCEVEVHDIASTDKRTELAVCSRGPRDDRSCRLYRYKSGAVQPLPIGKPGDEDEYSSMPSAVSTSGSGILLADQDRRFYVRRDKYLLRGDALVYVPQPFWVVDHDVHVDRSFPIVRQAGGGDVVANVRPDSDIRIRLESVDHPGWFLVHISSGLTGWVQLDALQGASDDLMGLIMAG